MQIRVQQRAFSCDAVVRFVMFHSVPANLIAKRVQKVILPVVAGAEQRAGFSHQLPVSSEVLRLHHQILFAVGD